MAGRLPAAQRVSCGRPAAAARVEACQTINPGPSASPPTPRPNRPPVCQQAGRAAREGGDLRGAGAWGPARGAPRPSQQCGAAPGRGLSTCWCARGSPSHAHPPLKAPLVAALTNQNPRNASRPRCAPPSRSPLRRTSPRRAATGAGASCASPPAAGAGTPPVHHPQRPNHQRTDGTPFAFNPHKHLL